MNSVSSVSFVIITLILCMICTTESVHQAQVSHERMLRAVSPSDTENDWHINITNTCNKKLKVHLRYYDGDLKHAISNNVRKNQRISLSTQKRVIVSLVAAQDSNGKDIFAQKCLSKQRNFMR